MGLQFTGVLSRTPPEAAQTTALMPGHAILPMDVSGGGLVVNLADWRPERESLEPYLDALGLLSADWLFLIYETWAGPIDYVEGYGKIGETRIERAAAYEEQGEELYLDLMDRFGLIDFAFQFPPLTRGFWD